MEILIGLIIGICLGCWLYNTQDNAKITTAELRIENLSKHIGNLEATIDSNATLINSLATQRTELEEKFETLQHQKISADVKMGQKSEQIAPLMENFPCPIHTVKFFGSPIDYISIDLDKELITFIEVKTGDSKLTAKQKLIRKIIQEKKITFAEYRFGDINKKNVNKKN